MDSLNKIQIPYTIEIQEFIKKLKDIGIYDRHRESLRFFKKNNIDYLEIKLDRELMDIMDLISLKQRKN